MALRLPRATTTTSPARRRDQAWLRSPSTRGSSRTSADGAEERRCWRRCDRGKSVSGATLTRAPPRKRTCAATPQARRGPGATWRRPGW
eukprot:2192162-Alexandrium_andersonii.AAC.1